MSRARYDALAPLVEMPDSQQATRNWQRRLNAHQRIRSSGRPKGGIITVLNEQGLKVDGVSYTKEQASQPGWTIVF